MTYGAKGQARDLDTVSTRSFLPDIFTEKGVAAQHLQLLHP